MTEERRRARTGGCAPRYSTPANGYRLDHSREGDDDRKQSPDTSRATETTLEIVRGRCHQLANELDQGHTLKSCPSGGFIVQEGGLLGHRSSIGPCVVIAKSTCQ